MIPQDRCPHAFLLDAASSRVAPCQKIGGHANTDHTHLDLGTGVSTRWKTRDVHDIVR